MSRALCLLAAGAVCAASAAAQDGKRQAPGQAHPKVDQARVDAAIKRGVQFLKTRTPGMGQPLPDDGRHPQRSDELVLWTLVHAGVPESDPEFQRLFRNMMETDLERTYLVSLQAMILEELDRAKYQWRIHQCAQFLVDNQADNGQWSYGEASLYVKDIPCPTDGDSRKDVATSSTGGRPRATAAPRDPNRREKPPVVRRIPVKKQREGPDHGDNSNSQYAMLGLRACHDAGLVLHKDVLQPAEKWWRRNQHQEREKNGGRGWCYGEKNSHAAYGSMTAGALGSLVICDYIQGKPWRTDRDVLDGLEWLATRFSVLENAGPPEHADGNTAWMYYYYLYALERAGILFGTETFGAHEWYPEGALVLLEAQENNGSWKASEHGHAIWDTCFAILFLRRATRPLEDVATGTRR